MSGLDRTIGRGAIYGTRRAVPDAPGESDRDNTALDLVERLKQIVYLFRRQQTWPVAA